jgi:hypothetical protein
MTGLAAAIVKSERATEWVFGLEWFEEPSPGTAVLTARNIAERCGGTGLATFVSGQSAVYAVSVLPPFGLKALLRRFSAAAALSSSMPDWSAGVWRVDRDRWWFLLAYNRLPIRERVFEGPAEQAVAEFRAWVSEVGPNGNAQIFVDPEIVELAGAAFGDGATTRTMALGEGLRSGRRVRLRPIDGRSARRAGLLGALALFVVVGISTVAYGAASAYFADAPAPVIAAAPPRPPALAGRSAPSTVLAACRHAWAGLMRDVPTWVLAELSCSSGRARALYQAEQGVVIQDVIRDAFGDWAVTFEPDFRKATIVIPVDVPKDRGAAPAPELAPQETRLRETSASTGFDIKIEPGPRIGERSPIGDNLDQRKVTITSPMPAIDWSSRLDELPGAVVETVSQRMQSSTTVWMIEGRIYGR